MNIEFIHQSFEIWNFPSREYTRMLEDAGRICYKSESRGEPEKFIQKLVERGHESVIEHAHVTVKFVTNRGVTHELVRHRLASYSQESTRYCNYSGKMRFVYPVWVNISFEEWYHKIIRGGSVADLFPQKPEDAFFRNCLEAAAAYNDLIKLGWTPEKAREVLPNALATEIVMTANLREWRHIFKLRCSKRAHPQIRLLMLGLLEVFQEEMPHVFSDLSSNQIE